MSFIRLPLYSHCVCVGFWVGGPVEDETIEDMILRGVCHLDAFQHFRRSGVGQSIHSIHSIQSWDT